MYGTIARMRVKVGQEAAFKQIAAETESAPVPGIIAVTIYQSDTDSREFFLAVAFESKAAYVANANSPEQHERYLKIRAVLEADPDWHDGAIVFASRFTSGASGL